jgi:hypothetical protein
MHMEKSLKRFCFIAPVLVLGALLGGCDRLDTSKPNDAELNTAVQAMDGTCRQWTVGDIQRLDAVPMREPGVGPMYAIKFSAVLTLKDPDGFSTSSNVNDFAGCPTMVVIRLRPAMNGVKPAKRYQILDAVPLTRSDSGWHMLNRDYISADAVVDIMRLMNMGLNFSSDKSPVTPLYGENPAPGGDSSPGIFNQLNERIASLFRSAPSSSNDSRNGQPTNVAADGVASATPATALSPASGSSGVVAPVTETAPPTSDSATSVPAASRSSASADMLVPKFSDYPSGPLYNGPVHALVPDESGKEYRTNLSSVLDYYAKDLRDHGRITQTQGIVAGHYAIASWGCGSGGCNTGALVDLGTGQAYSFPFAITGISSLKPEYKDSNGEARPGQDQDFETRPNSRLMVVAGNLDDNGEKDDTVEFIEFTGSGFRTILSRPWGHEDGSASPSHQESTMPVQGGVTVDPAAVSPQAQLEKLPLLLRRAQDEFHRAQYPSAVATAEAVLLLDPANTRAQQLRARALRLEQEPTARVSPPRAIASAQPPTPPLTQVTPAPQPANRTLVLADLEGDWHGTYQCSASSGSGSVHDPDAWSHRVRLTVRNGQAQLVRQSHGEHPYREVLSGTVANDLTLQLGGNGQYADAQHAWTSAFTGRFAGTTEQPAFRADGTLTNWHGEKTRTCHLALGR